LCFPHQSLVARQGRSVQKHHGRLSGSSRRHFDRSQWIVPSDGQASTCCSGPSHRAWYAPARRDSGRPDASTGQDMWWGCVRSGPG
jgi:hypothetical protein